MAKREDSPTLYSYVREYIIKLIVSGKYPPHSQLPTEYQLMEELNVGRATVRAALAQLENEGTIYKRQGVGTFVSERGNHYGLEPFLSFNFALKHVGIQNNNDIVDQQKITAEEAPLTDRWEKGTELYEFKRLRKSGDAILGLEDNYYTPYAYDKLDLDKLEDSLAHNFLSNLERPISSFDTHVEVRPSTKEEQKTLGIPASEKVIYYVRWIYLEGIEEPVNLVRFLVPTHVTEFPFLG